MAWLFENPFTILGIGLAVEVVLGVLLFSTGQGRLLGAMLAVAVVTFSLVIAERLVVTDREQVASTLYGVASAAERNSVPAVVEFISPSATDLVTMARKILPTFTITEARIGRNLEIDVDSDAQPQTATAQFMIRVHAKDKKGQSPYENYFQQLKVVLRREGDRWRILSVEQQGLPRG